MSSGLLIEEIFWRAARLEAGAPLFLAWGPKTMVQTQVHDLYVLLIQAPYSAGKVLEERWPHPRSHRHTQVRLLPEVSQEQVTIPTLLDFLFSELLEVFPVRKSFKGTIIFEILRIVVFFFKILSR